MPHWLSFVASFVMSLVEKRSERSTKLATKLLKIGLAPHRYLRHVVPPSGGSFIVQGIVQMCIVRNRIAAEIGIVHLFIIYLSMTMLSAMW